MIIKNWEDYKQFAFNTIGELKDKPEDVIFLNLQEVIGNMFGAFKKEIISNQINNEELLDRIGDIIWNIAIIEVHFGLMPSRASNTLNYELKFVNDIKLELDSIALQGQICEILMQIFDAELEDDFDTLEYGISQLFSILIDILLPRKLQLKDVLVTSVKKLNAIQKATKQTIAATEDPYKNEYKEAKEKIKQSKDKEITFDILTETIEKEGNVKTMSIYKGLKIKNGRKITKFESGEIILDYFNASNAVASQLSNKHYSLLYTPELRAVLHDLINKRALISAYIYEGTLVPATSLKKGDNPDVFADKSKYRPVLIKPVMKTLDQLLVYISETKNRLNKKL